MVSAVSPGKKGGSFDSFKIRNSSATNSTSPVEIFLFTVCASRSFTVPVTAITYSFRRADALS